jgi:hypothetical protein
MTINLFNLNHRWREKHPLGKTKECEIDNAKFGGSYSSLRFLTRGEVMNKLVLKPNKVSSSF